MNRCQLQAEHFDLEATMTCGQTFAWHRIDGDLYGEGRSEFYTFRNGKPLIVREKEGKELEIETDLPLEEAKIALGIEKNLEDVFESMPVDERLEAAMEEYWGLRVLQDEFLPCLVSYICSSQMRIERIKKMHDSIAERYGETVEYNGRELLKFPDREQLAQIEEEELRDMGLGYRAEYVAKTAEILQDFDEEEIKEMEYEEAREKLKELHGVGNKVAECVMLFSLGFHEAVPLDTWGKKILKTHYPDIHHSRYEKASENVREHFGENAGYAQEYLFHAARNGVIEVEE
jgi:N-glycosylase/DNA lyase